MSSSVLVIISFIICGILNVLINKYLFKDSIVYKVVVILTFPTAVIGGLGYLLGILGMSHVVWIVLLVLIVSTTSNYILKIKVKDPLNKILEKINTLSEGNVNVEFDEKDQSGNNEIAEMYRLLAKLTRSLKNSSLFAHDIGNGKLDAEYELSGDNDELGKAMLNMRTSLVKADEDKKMRQVEDDKRNWVTTGVAKFAEILRNNNDDIIELSNEIISNLLKYINANQGGVFIINDDDPNHLFLELQASYAYERKKYLKKTIEMGEGLVGTCYLERDSIYITQVPPDYIHITSGLGDESPRALLLVPLKVNEEIYGVIEIASFRQFEPHVLEFVEKVAESIASTISTVKVNIRTQKLLEVSKIQSEEMLNQEEELRQNMEEMQATQEEMRRRENDMLETLNRMKDLQKISANKELEFEQLFKAVNESFHVIEFSADGTLTNVNNNVLNAHQLPKDAFVGKPLSFFVRETPEEMEKLMFQLQHGKTQTKEQEVTANGKTTLFKHEFIPFVDLDGAVYKIVLIAYAV